jgi:succinate-semialdehyde dehydrogenase/glutarate-semialdehyde dehydrogenase
MALANDSLYGLTASVWTRSREQAEWFAERLEAGSVTVNDHMYSFVEPRAIWGGIKQTGMGRSHGPFGLHELVNIKYVSLDFLGKKSQTWWFPYDRGLEHILEKTITAYYGEGLRRRLGAVFSLRSGVGRILRTSSVMNYVKSLPRIFKR